MNVLISTILVLLMCYLHHSLALPRPRLNNSTDQDALLSFKSYVTNDPNGVLETWNSNTSFCNWEGVLCNANKHRVTGLALANFSLSGTISPHITNLSFLQLLDLQNNSFGGSLPRGLGRLFRLQTLILRSNIISGTLPSSLSHCSKLRVLDLSENRIEGTIHHEVGMLSALEDLSFSKNNLTGEIPASFGNCSQLNNLILLSNNLQGQIPNDLGQLQFLLQLSLGDNNLEGEIPTSVFNISSLLILTLAKNRISGRLPPNLFTRLPSLTTLFLGGNLLEGPIPASISNASKLERIDLSVNNFTGQIPFFRNLPNIQILNLEINHFDCKDNNGLDFITSLSNSTLLRVFSVATNELTGRLPSSIGKLSSQLNLLNLAENHLEGNIPEEIGNLSSLILLSLESNSFSGNIPSTIGNLQNLQKLALDMNNLSGIIPESLGKLKNVYELGLSRNNLSGRIPSILSNCQFLQSLDLSLNRLYGDIPKEIFAYPNLGTLLNLSWNSLTGTLPSEIGKLKMVQRIDISKNRLSGTIPATLGGCSNLVFLDLSSNSFQGNIPNSFSQLKGIEYIDLSSNNLSGLVPSSLESLQFLQLLNLSVNQLHGEVPMRGIFVNKSGVSLNGNHELCGGIVKLGLPRCATTGRRSNKSKLRLIIGIVIGSIAFFVIVAVGFFLLLCRKRKPNEKARNDDYALFNSPQGLYSYYHLRAATDNFNSRNLIGEGSFGSVFKGVLGDGSLVAVKVFNMDQHGATKSFLAECEALRNIRHRNLLKIITVCSTSQFKALVLKFMPNGSLDNWLHCRTGSNEVERRWLNMQQRLEIAVNVASAMEYLHYECGSSIVHCDLKPSNILLDDDMTAHVGDFGLARMLHSNFSDRQRSSTLGLKGSIGYIAPEYGLGGDISTKGDVYSYGVLLLEMFTGRKPTSELFTEGLNLRKWVRSALPDQLMEILDTNLMEDCKVCNKDCLAGVIKIGLSCAADQAEDRPSMRDVTVMITRMRSMIYN